MAWMGLIPLRLPLWHCSIKSMQRYSIKLPLQLRADPSHQSANYKQRFENTGRQKCRPFRPFASAHPSHTPPVEGRPKLRLVKGTDGNGDGA